MAAKGTKLLKAWTYFGISVQFYNQNKDLLHLMAWQMLQCRSSFSKIKYLLRHHVVQVQAFIVNSHG